MGKKPAINSVVDIFFSIVIQTWSRQLKSELVPWFKYRKYGTMCLVNLGSIWQSSSKFIKYRKYGTMCLVNLGSIWQSSSKFIMGLFSKKYGVFWCIVISIFEKETAKIFNRDLRSIYARHFTKKDLRSIYARHFTKKYFPVLEGVFDKGLSKGPP